MSPYTNQYLIPNCNPDKDYLALFFDAFCENYNELYGIVEDIYGADHCHKTIADNGREWTKEDKLNDYPSDIRID